MAKKQSSASSGTRKKNAAKAAKKGGGDAEDAPRPAQRGEKKKKEKRDRFAPKIKTYTPPPPPPKGQPDPVDLYLVVQGKHVDPELVVVLRRLMKKDEATVLKGVEALEAWVKETLRIEKDGEGEDWEREMREEGVVDAMAVWAHHFPRLSLHPSRRLRLQVHSLHSLLLLTGPSASATPIPSLLPQTRAALLAPLWVENPQYVGAWAVASWDTDRAVRREAKRSWESVVVLPSSAPPADGEEQVEVEGVVLVDSAESIADFALAIALGHSQSSSGAGGTDTPQELEDPAFLRTSSLLALAYLLNTLPVPLTLSENVVDALTSYDLWSLLDRSGGDPRRTGPESEQPQMVRRAGYDLLEALAMREEEILVQAEKGEKTDGEEDEEEEDENENDAEERLRTVASKVLANCWAEEDGWAGIVAFLRRYPQAWTLADSSLSTAANSPSNDEAIEEEATPVSTSFTPSPVISLFFNHLSTACSSHPTPLYPTVLLLLSTVSSSLLPATSDALSVLFTSLWSACSSRALTMGGRFATDSWLTAVLECVIYELGRLESAEQRQELAKEFIGGKVWSALLGTEEGEKPLGSKKTAGELEKALARLAVKSDLEGVWEDVRRSSLALFSALSDDSASLPPLAVVLSSLASSKNDEVAQRGLELARDTVKAAISQVQQTDGAKDDLLTFLSSASHLVRADFAVTVQLDALASSQLPPLLPTSPAALSLLVSHLSAASPASRDKIWASLFSPLTPSSSTLLSVLEALPSELAEQLPSANLDDHLLALASGQVLADPHATFSSADLALLQRIILAPSPLASSAVPSQLLTLASSALTTPVSAALARRWSAPPELDALVAPVALLSHAVAVAELASGVAEEAETATALFDVAYLLPTIRLEDRGVYVPGEAVEAAKRTWEKLMKTDKGSEVAKKVLATLQARIVDAGQRASPVELVEAASTLVDTLSSSAGFDLLEVLPSKETVEALYAGLNLSAPPPALAILDTLVPLTSSTPASEAAEVDDASLTPFSRALLALLDLSARDHALLRRAASAWTLPHLLLLAQTASDELLSPSASSGSSVFGPSPLFEVLERFAAAAEGASNYVLSSLSNNVSSGWHASAVAHLRSTSKPASATVPWEKDALLAALDSLFRAARTGSDEGKKVQAARSVRTVLSAVLRYSEEGEGTQDAERWLALAQTITGSPVLSSAILIAIKPILFETPRFVRYQNELAASLAGVPATQLDTKALPLLQQLLASAPPLDAPIIFLPQQRSVFLLQAVSRWIGSDEVLPEGLETGLVELFGHLAPVVQELSGSHWDLMFDLIESSLDGADWVEPTTLPGIYHSCRLIALIQELAASNADLRVTAKSRLDGALELVLGLFVSRPASASKDRPRELVVETMAKLVRDLPPKLLSMEKSFSQLLRLLQDPSLAVQLSSYNLLRRIIAQHISDLVVETELDTEEAVKIEYPAELMKLLGAPLKDGEEAQKATSYLFAWMTAFAFFESASPRVREAFLEQLRNVEFVTSSLLPSLFGLLSLSDRTRPVDLSPWFIDDFHFEYFDTDSPLTLPIFAAHVYYRALQTVPSTIRTYWTSLQNLALSRTIQSFTSRNFSPLLIDDELAVLRDPSTAVGKQLRDNEEFTVKVADNGKEVKVVFVVDEESMELGIKVPSDFPLVGIEVRDVRKVGVTDKMWRAWLLGMQQVIMNQSATVADALLLFKRNVTLHFEGVESCAICYSTVSTLDRSLPTKKCKTCDNKFHAGCLFKWFSTSHGSTCPLCRQIM